MATRGDIVMCTKDDANYDDSSVTNKWKWEWMDKVVTQEGGASERAGIFVRKVLTAGHAHCILCRSKIVYGSRGVIAITDHLKCRDHINLKKLRKDASTLKGKSV